MSELPREIREQLGSYISETTDDALDLIANLTGKYIDEQRREKLRKKAKLEIEHKILEAITKAYQMGLELTRDYQQKKLEGEVIKQKFYTMTDAIFRSVETDIPRDVHAMDYIFRAFEDLHRDFRFTLPYLGDTRYDEYLSELNEFIAELKKKDRLGKAFDIWNEFKSSKDAYIIVQVALQKLIKHYDFLQRDFLVIKKKQIDRYLEIYDELSGVYEKLVSLIRALVYLLINARGTKYETVRRKELSKNIKYIEKTRWRLFVYGYDRNIRNAIAHKTCKVDIVKERIDFIDRERATTKTFTEVQKQTRELSALLLVLPHLLIALYVSSVLRLRDMLESI
jgi:hypothetical protein